MFQESAGGQNSASRDRCTRRGIFRTSKVVTVWSNGKIMETSRRLSRCEGARVGEYRVSVSESSSPVSQKTGEASLGASALIKGSSGCAHIAQVAEECRTPKEL